MDYYINLFGKVCFVVLFKVVNLDLLGHCKIEQKKSG